MSNTTDPAKREFRIGDEVSISGKFKGQVTEPVGSHAEHRPSYPAAYVTFKRPHRPSEWTNEGYVLPGLNAAPGLVAFFNNLLPPSMGAWFHIEDLDRWNA